MSKDSTVFDDRLRFTDDEHRYVSARHSSAVSKDMWRLHQISKENFRHVPLSAFS